MSLVRAFREAGWETHFASGAKATPGEEGARGIEMLRALGVTTHFVAPNDPAFDPWIAALRPDFAIFERFLIEEQFGWRIHEASPATIRVLDTVDLHFVRTGKKNDDLREVASIYRSDLTLLISPHENELLANPPYSVPQSLLEIFGFCYDPAPPLSIQGSGFVVIGNFRHAPNSDGVLWLKQQIWPHIRKQLPQAHVNIFGAYPSREMMDLSDPGQGFFVKGHTENACETLSKYRVNLAPLRFGAGLKGKIADGWWSGIPAVTTSVGAAGMRLSGTSGVFGGEIEDDPKRFAEKAIQLHEDSARWREAVLIGRATLAQHWDYRTQSSSLLQRLGNLRLEIDASRASNFTGKMLRHHAHQSTKHLSRWIELKNRTAL